MYCCCCSVLRSRFDSDDDNATPHRDNNAPHRTGRQYSIIADASGRYNKKNFWRFIIIILNYLKSAAIPCVMPTYARPVVVITIIIVIIIHAAAILVCGCLVYDIRYIHTRIHIHAYIFVINGQILYYYIIKSTLIYTRAYIYIYTHTYVYMYIRHDDNI